MSILQKIANLSRAAFKRVTPKASETIKATLNAQVDQAVANGLDSIGVEALYKLTSQVPQDAKSADELAGRIIAKK